MKLSKRRVIYLIAIVLITAMLSATVTILITNATKENEVVLSVEEYEALKEADMINEIMDRVSQLFIGEVPTREELLSAAANGILTGIGDEYAQYFTKAEYEEYLSKLNGEYSGLGILVSQLDEKGMEILDVYEGNPAANAGVQIGDYITAVDGESVFEHTHEEVTTALDGEVGSTVKLTILRTDGDGQETLDIEVTRDVVNIKRVYSSLYNERTGYIRITTFSQNSVTEFEEAIRNLKERGMKSLVIDLRDNPGGNLNAVVDIADMLLPACDIVTVEGKSEENGHVYKSDGTSLGVPIAVIVNENSASASEILAAAIQENDAGIVVGTQTYGKGVVQTFISVDSSQGWLKLTTDQYLTPNGNDIHKVGVTPDIVVELPDVLKGLSMTAIAKDYQAEDTQLWAALDYVREKASQNIGQ